MTYVHQRAEERERWIPALVAVAKAMMGESEASTSDLVAAPTTTLPSEIFTKATATVQECSDPISDLQALIQTAEAEKADLERELALVKQIKYASNYSTSFQQLTSFLLRDQQKKGNQDTDVVY